MPADQINRISPYLGLKMRIPQLAYRIPYRLRVLLPVLLITGIGAFAQVDEINPLIGTKGMFVYGRTTPFVTPPFGMTHWTPMTWYPDIAWNQYKYHRRKIIGFRGSHKPAMWMGDYGYVTLMPGAGRAKVAAYNRGFRFPRKKEFSAPDIYTVSTRDEAISVEMTASERCGAFVYQIEKRRPWVYIEASRREEFNGFIRVDSARREVWGYNPDHAPAKIQPPLDHLKGWFVVRFDQPISSWEISRGKRTYDDLSSASGGRVGAFIRFREKGEVKAKVGTSFISLEQARANLDAEIPDWDFEAVRQNNRDLWEKYLNRIEVKGGTESDRRIFYTAMYHCLLFPRKFYEGDHYYSPFDGQIHPGKSFTDFSFWDTFRAEHPLLLLIAPEESQQMIFALGRMFMEGGRMPKWPNPGYTNIMIGTHADAVVADAFVKGYRDYDWKTIWAAVYADCNVPPDGDREKRWGDRDEWSGYEGRGGLSWYKELGYVPEDKTAESVSRTIEFSYDDYCAAQLAYAMGKHNTSKGLYERSLNYRNLYNPETGFFAPKNADGTWYKDPKAGFTEGSPWTYLFGAMHDPEGMIELMGRENFRQKLDENFDKGHYVHENEPGHHYAYLYNYLGDYRATQERVAHYRQEKYRDHPNGMDGDDDCGQMSAWYVFSALGFYPVAPGKPEYALGTPLFPEVILHPDPADSEKTFRIVAHDAAPGRIHVKRVTLNGKELEKPFLPHQAIMDGGLLEFWMEE